MMRATKIVCYIDEVTLGSYLKMGLVAGGPTKIRGLELSVPPLTSLPPISGEERESEAGSPDGQ